MYLESFTLPDEKTETGYIISCGRDAYKSMMSCYPKDLYPFKVFPPKELTKITFEPITIFYGGNGSGKSTLLNVMAEKLGLEHDSPANHTPYFEEYLGFCKYTLRYGQKIPKGSSIVTSDDVFDFLLNVRAMNQGIDRRREELFDEYKASREDGFTLRSLEDYEELKRHNEARGMTKNAYTVKRLPTAATTQSNGESAMAYFGEKIKENALYLLDEPENSLSASLQKELARFLLDSARFYGCQFVISTHSPFLLSIKGAKIYDLDRRPVSPVSWTELEAVREYYELFKSHREAFEGVKKP